MPQPINASHLTLVALGSPEADVYAMFIDFIKAQAARVDVTLN